MPDKDKWDQYATPAQPAPDKWSQYAVSPATTATLPPEFGTDTFRAAVHSQMLGIDPGTAYQGRDEIDHELRAVSADYDDGKLDDSIYNDLAVGLEGSIIGLHHREKLPEQVRNPGMIDRFVSGVAQTLADAPWYFLGALGGGIAGGAAGSEAPVVGNITLGAIGAGAGGFALPSAMREALVLGIKNGEVKSYSDLLHRSAKIVWAGTKGAAMGVVSAFTGEIPVGSFIAKSGVASMAVKGLYQATTLSTTADLLEGRLPNKEDFAGNAALIVPLNLITGGFALRGDTAEQAVMDEYVKSGKTPQETAEKLTAQPPVKPDLPPGLRPAIKIGDQFLEGNENEIHAELAERLGSKPVTMAELEADPSLSDKVLQEPQTNLQDVIDRAWALKKEAIDRGDVEAPTESVPQKPLYEMSPEEIDAAHTEAAGRDQADLVDLFGQEGAKRYSALQRKANSSIDMQGADRASEQIQEMESGLTKEQQDRLYGIGDTRHQLEDINEYRSALGRIDDSSPDALSESLKWAVSQIDDPSKPVEEMSPKQQVRYAQLRYAFETAQANGWDTSAIIKKAILSAAERFPDPADAIAVLEKVARSVGESGQTQAALPGEVEQQKPLTIDDLYNRASMKSGRGFVTPDGKFLSWMEAKQWMKQNEPDVHEIWTDEVEGDKQAELHAEDYAAARERVQARNVADGEPALNGMSPLEVHRRAAARKDLNDIKAGLTSRRYAWSAIRTMFTGERDYRIGLTKDFHDRLEKVIPGYRDQEALTYLRDYKGDPEALQAKIEAVNAGDDEKEKALNPSRERALNPSPQLLEADRMMTEYMKWALQDGQPYGLYQNSRIDPSHYSPHLLGKVLEEGEEPRGTGSAGFTKRTSHDIERKYATIDEATGKSSIEARTVNSLESLVEYGNKHATAVATRSLLMEFKNTQLGMVGSRDDVPEGWVRLAPNMPEFTRSMLSKDSGTGENKAISQSFFVPKEVAQAMRPIITHDVVSSFPGYRTLAKLQGVTKAMELGFSLFHLKSEALQALNNAKYTDLMHAWGGDVTPEDAREWGADGLVTSETKIPYEAWGKLKQSSLPSRLDYLRGLPVIKQVDEAAAATTSFIFDTVLPKFKITSANLKLAAWESDHPEATDQETFAARREIAKQVNSVFGGLNWEAMGWDKNALKLMRLVMLAPDWTFSNVMGLKYAALDRGVAGNASRMFLFRSFATGLLATQALSYGLSGQASENPTEVYLGTDKNGKKLYANWFFAGLPKDMHTLLQQVLRNGAETGLINTLANKLGPIAGAANRLQKNQDWEGKPIVKKNEGSVEKTAREIGFSAGQFLPFAATNAYDAVKNMVMDTDHEYTQQQVMEVLGDVMGAQVYHERTPSGTSAREQFIPGAGRGSQRSNKFSIRSAR